jgi:hypothetical protein
MDGCPILRFFSGEGWDSTNSNPRACIGAQLSRYLRGGIARTRHRLSAKHLEAYLNEMTFRINNRENPYLFRDTLMKLIEAPVLEYKKLTAAQSHAPFQNEAGMGTCGQFVHSALVQ